MEEKEIKNLHIIVKDADTGKVLNEITSGVAIVAAYERNKAEDLDFKVAHIGTAGGVLDLLDRINRALIYKFQKELGIEKPLKNDDKDKVVN